MNGKRHSTIAATALLLGNDAWAAAADRGIQFFPEQASSVARQVDYLFFFLVFICTIVGVGIALALIYFSIRYHHTRAADRGPIRINTLKIEIAWSVIPLAIFMVIFVWAGWLYFHLQQMPTTTALQIYGIGQQWMWTFQHPGGVREINDLHVPIGRDVKMILTSEDVIHSFYIPDFRVKQDVLPDRYTYVWFKATKLGAFHLFCAEYCGTYHSGMRGMVYVMQPDEYQRWLAGREPAGGLAEKGRRLFSQLGCASCHVAGAGVRAPLLQNLYGRQVRLDDGRTITADDPYIRDSILLPQKDVVAGYPPVMPTFRGIVKEDETLALIEYIKTLREAAEGAPR
ncbi:MAG: cytochrome c oxidase subunit II [Candidatus Sumerlaeia bacterium]